ncbi:iron uptake transporter deferrochelatase/peroxidase subunit [Marihabitans asiaticum]
MITHDPVAARASMSAFRVTAQDRGELAELFEILTATIADLQAGRLPDSRDPSFPARETGILGAEVQPDHLGIAVSVGASLFDERFGLADRKPKNLAKMPFLANDRLDPQRSHGDLLLTIEADHPDTMQHALRQIMRAARAHMVMAWTIEGYSRGTGGGHGSGQTPRNLMGFKDGTNNLDMTDDRVMDEFVWVGADDGEPEWAVGGSYHVVRVIRMFVEFWDRTRIVEQEQIFGRHKVSGAPLGSEDEFAPINHSADPDGETIPLDSHIRLATPQTPDASGDVILRRGFSYTRGVDGSGQLDQGLAFVSFQRRLEQFLNIQARLDGEPLEEYILPEGGGFFFALPGVEDEGTSLGARLLA